MIGDTSELETIQTSLLRAMASPHRLRIIHLLGQGPCEVREIARHLGIGQAAASQHLAAMRAVGLVEPARHGRNVRYALTDPEIVEACDLMRDVLVRRLSQLGNLAAAAQEPDSRSTPNLVVTDR